MRRLASVLCVLTLATLGCNANGQGPVLDLELEKTKVTDHLAGLLAAENLRDVEGALAFYSEDLYFVAPGMDVVQGANRMREILTAAFENDSFTNSHEYIDVQCSEAGDLCFVVGRYHLSTEDPEFEFPKDGKFLLILRKTDGEWKVVVNCFNQ